MSQKHQTSIAKPKVPQVPTYQTQGFVTPVSEFEQNRFVEPRKPDTKALFQNTKPLEIQSLFDSVKITPEVKKASTSSAKTDRKDEEDVVFSFDNAYDVFYSPILEKIDKILNGLQFTEEPCRERLICSMYKNPEKFSPHSNLLSNELSR